MIQLEEHLKKNGHDTHTVAKITKKNGELEKMQYLHRATWKTKTEGNRGLLPSGSERPELDPEGFSDVDILERPDKRRRAEKIKKLGGTPKQRREQIRATLWPGYCVCESGNTRMRIMHRLLLVGPLLWTASRSHITALSPLLLRSIPRSASGEPQRRPQRNRMSRTLRRRPSYTIPDESTPQRSAWLGVPQNAITEELLSSLWSPLGKRAAVSLSSRGGDQ